MNLETLQYFQHIAKYKNITKAARHFYISQSTLSRQIMALESELGAQLFIRNNKNVELTEAGKVFMKDCDLFIKHMQVITENVQAAAQGNFGILRITSPGELCKTFYDSLIAFQKKYPSVQLVVEAYDFNEISTTIQHGVYNVGFTFDFATADYEEIESVPIGTDDFSLAVSSKLFPNPSINLIPEIVKSLPLILPHYTEPLFLKRTIHELQHYSGVRKIHTNYVNTTDSVMLDVSLGLGFSIIPTYVSKSKSGMENISYIKLDDAFVNNCTIVMLYKKSMSSELVNCFVDIVKELSKDFCKPEI
jgi:DNA-binding transcriptional LysR family regulator